MCILFLAINQHPRYPLIIAANRDEIHQRPSQPMHYWPDHPEILAGRDELKGGSWLGINQSGKFCAVTNFRTGQMLDSEVLSRGALVKMYLEEKFPASEFQDLLFSQGGNYGPFNLVFGDTQQLHLYCNQNNRLTSLGDGFHSVSNGYFDHHWPKMSLGVQKLTEIVTMGGEIEIEKLNRIMYDQSQAPDKDLPCTGVSREVERSISSIFIKGDAYGTRTTSYVLFSEQHVQVHELNYDASGDTISTQVFNLPLPDNHLS